MIYKDLKKSILDYAMMGKLVSNSTIDDVKDKLNFDSSLTDIDKISKPFNIPNNWFWARIGDLGETNDNNSFSDGPFGSNLKTIHYTKKPEVRIIQLSNIGEDGWIDDNTKYTTYEHLKTISRCEVHYDDIVIAKMMPAGRPILVPKLGTKIVLGSDAVKFVPNKCLNKRYLIYAIKSPMFLKQVYNEVHGITRVRTSLNKIKNYIIPIPPIDEQQRIVNKLDELNCKINQIKPIEEELASMKNLFPAKFKKSVLQSYMHLSNFYKGNKDEWSEKKLKELVNISTGKKDANYGSIDGKYLFFTCSKAPIRCNDYSFEGESILLAGNGNIGNINYYNGKFEAYQRTYVLQKKSNDINLKYLYYHLLANWEDYNMYQIFGTAIPYIKLKNVQEYMVRFPTIEEQIEIVDKIEKMLPICDEIEILVNK